MRKLIRYLFSFVRFSGLVVLAIALTSLSGHISGHAYLYSWTAGSGMGMNTSLAFILVGISLVSLANTIERNHA